MNLIEIERFVAATLPGRKLGDQLFGAGAYGKLFELFDERFADPGPRKQVIRILPSTPNNGEWRAKVAQQVQALLTAQLPAISRPLEAGELPDGGLYLIGDFYSQPLDGLIQDEQGLRPVEVLPIVRQLLRGLAALHSRGMAHGDVRPKNVFLVPQNGTKLPPSVWLIDTPIGGLAWWSNNALLDPESKAFYPPEYRTAPQTPSPKADLWALGLTICEMLVGRQSNPQRSLQKLRPSGEDLKASHVRSAVDGQLKKGGAGFVLRKLVWSLLSEEAGRPSDGVAGMDLLARLEQKTVSRPWKVGTAAASFIGVFFLLLSVLLQMWLSASTADLKVTKATLDGRKADLAECNRQLDIASPPRAPAPPPPHQQDDPSRKLWQELIAVKGKSYPDFNSALKAVDDEVAKRQPDEEETKSFTRWHNVLYSPVQRGEPWLTDKYPNFGDALTRAFNEPWETKRLDDANEWLDSYEEAAKQWREWANNDDELPFGTINAPGFVEGLRVSDKAKQQVRTWLTDAQGRMKWVARLTKGIDGNGNRGTTRQFGISGGAWVFTPVHDWLAPKGHDFRNDQDDSNRRIDFSYRVTENKPLQCILYGERTSWKIGARTVLIEETIKGPLPFWKLHHQGWIQSQDGTILLRLEIDGCPGPPKDWKKSVDLRETATQ